MDQPLDFIRNTNTGIKNSSVGSSRHIKHGILTEVQEERNNNMTMKEARGRESNFYISL